MILKTLAIMLTAAHCTISGASLIDTNDKCGLHTVTRREVNLYLHSKRNATGRWKTTFSVQTDATNKPSDDGIEFKLKQSVIKCGDKEFLQVQGVLEQESVTEVMKNERYIVKTTDGMPNSTTEGERPGEKNSVAEVKKGEPLFFEKGAKNTEFSNERRTVRTKTGESYGDYGSAITNRPLKDGELFEVKLDEINKKWTNGFAIGLTTHSPAESDFPDRIAKMKNGTLVYVSKSIYHNGWKGFGPSYGRDLLTLRVGERVGVTRREGDTVHFFVNGVDQGAVKHKFYGTMYGVVEVAGGAVQATIVNPK